MMKRENLKAILVVVLVVLGIMFIVTLYDENKEVIQGLAFIEQMGCTCMQDGRSVGGNDCLSWDPPSYCLAKGDPPECTIVDDCVECGCVPPYECIDGVCARGDGSNPPPPPPTGEYCAGHWDCGVFELCIGKDEELVNIIETNEKCYESDYDEGNDCGQCYASTEREDGYCASNYLEEFGYRVMNDDFESCEEWGDCKDGIGPVEGGCPIGDICLFNPVVQEGRCSEYEQLSICEDGTFDGQCSNSSYGYLCQDGDLINDSCQFCEIPYEFCPAGYECSQDGSCSAEIDEINDNGGNDEEDNYCEYVGGTCEGQCGEGFYDVSELEGYEQLTDSCVEEFGTSEVCCYPYENDDLNDCTYYNGSCMTNECSGNYISPDIEYLDEECEYYVGEDYVCCLEYLSDSSEETEEKGFFEYIFGEQTSNEYSGDQELGESFSLNRSYIFGGLFLVAFAILMILLFAPKKK